MIFLKAYWRQIVIVALLSAIAYKIYDFGYENADNKWQQKWDKEQSEIAQAKIKESELNRAKEQEKQAAINEVAKNAQTEINAANRDADVARDKSAKLLKQLKAYEAKQRYCTTNNAITAGTGEAAGENRLVFSELFARMDEAGRRIAEQADRSRIAGLACEAAYSVK